MSVSNKLPISLALGLLNPEAGMPTRLCDETDLNALNNDLVGVVWETMQPAHPSTFRRRR